MKTHRSGRLFILLALAVLILAACQPAALETSSPAAGAATQPVAAGTEAPAPLPTGTTAAAETPATVATTEVVSTTAPSGEGTGLPPAGMQVPEGWQVLTDTAGGYSLAYPAEWEACEEHRYSRIFCEIQAEPSGLGPPLRLYVLAVPQDYTNPDFETYNFIPADTIGAFMALPVGEAMLKEPNAIPPEYFSYTRLDDQTVAGWTALVIENSKVWEFPAGTKDRLVILVTEGTTYILGMYYETPEQLELFEQVLDSFQFAP